MVISGVAQQEPQMAVGGVMAITGDLTASGNFQFQVGGILSATGVLLRAVAMTTGGTMAIQGVVIGQTGSAAKTVSGVMAPTGFLNCDIATTLTGTMAISGVALLQGTAKIVNAGPITFTGPYAADIIIT